MGVHLSRMPPKCYYNIDFEKFNRLLIIFFHEKKTFIKRRLDGLLSNISWIVIKSRPEKCSNSWAGSSIKVLFLEAMPLLIKDMTNNDS